MNFEFDLWGWYVGQAEEPGARTTTTAPANTSTADTEGELRANWTGLQWIDVPYEAPVDLPPVPEPQPVFSLMTKLGFRSRFTQGEKTIIELGGVDDPAAPMAQRAQAAAIRVYLADVAAATFIDPKRADTRAGVQALEAGGLIAAGRALEILDAPIQPLEAFRGKEG